MHNKEMYLYPGDSWKMTQGQQKKLNRLSRSVCTEVEYMVEDAPATSVSEVSTPEVSTPEVQEPSQTEEDDSSIFNFFGFG